MSVSKINIITNGSKCIIGNTLVFSPPERLSPVFKTRKKASKWTKDNSNTEKTRYQQATIYGEAIVEQNHPEFAAAQPGSAFAIAIANFMEAPDIEKIDLSQYNGQNGDKIFVSINESCKATSLKVSIFNPDDSVLEHGLALQQNNLVDWVYTVKGNSSHPGDKLVITVLNNKGQ